MTDSKDHKAATEPPLDCRVGRLGRDAMNLKIQDQLRLMAEDWYSRIGYNAQVALLSKAADALENGEPQRLLDVEAAGHRLALELECLLLDTKDLPTVSRWWSSGMEALDEWQKLFPYNGPRLGD